MKILFLSLLLICFASLAACGGNNKKPGKSHMDRASYYNDLIKDVIGISPKQLGLKLSDKETLVYGVITEQNVGGFLLLVSAAYNNGEIVEIVYGGNCLVISGENGIKSGISRLMYDTANKYLKYYEEDIKKYWKKHDELALSKNLLMTLFIEQNSERVRNEAKKFVESAQKYIGGLTSVEKEGSLPEAGEIKIIFLTNKGRFFVQDTTDAITAYGSKFALFFKERSDIASMVFSDFSFTGK
ncbi:MAG: hypothetical protein LBD46_01160 [Endomicrobium sp.]|jgi:hypothetical protein|nr:hypothetical protein [Endomicrobium sp.]